MKALSSVLIVVALAQTSPLKQDSPPPAKEVVCATHRPCSLVGKPTVGVLVESLRDDAKAAGMSESQIQTDVELELRHHGIKVGAAISSDLVLYVHVDAVREIVVNSQGIPVVSGDPVCASIVHISCQQVVRLVREPKVVLANATTWETAGRTSIGPTSTLKNSVTEYVRDMTRQFINAYLEANPK